MKLSLRIGVVSAFTLIGFLAAPGPGRAECFRTVGANTCALFDPVSSSAVVDTGGFTGTFPNGFTTFTQARVLFATDGLWQNPFTISGITLKGDGITTSLNFGNLSITPSGSWMAGGNNATGYVNLDTSIGTFNLVNSKLSFVIPANVAPKLASISARLVYSNAEGGIMVTSNSDFQGIPQSTAFPATPSPLPFLGVTSAFAFSRRLRQRMRRNA